MVVKICAIIFSMHQTRPSCFTPNTFLLRPESHTQFCLPQELTTKFCEFCLFHLFPVFPALCHHPKPGSEHHTTRRLEPTAPPDHSVLGLISGAVLLTQHNHINYLRTVTPALYSTADNSPVTSHDNHLFKLHSLSKHLCWVLSDFVMVQCYFFSFQFSTVDQCFCKI